MSETTAPYVLPSTQRTEGYIPAPGTDPRTIELERQLHGAHEHIHCQNILIEKLQANTLYIEGQRDAWRQMHQDLKDQYDRLKAQYEALKDEYEA
jgi:hypothetical protein